MAAVWQEAGAGDGAMASRGVVTVVCFVRVYRDECVFISSRHGGGVAAALVGRAGGSLSVTGELMCHPEVVRADSTPAAL